MAKKTPNQKQQERAKNIYILFALGAVMCFSGIHFLVLSGMLAVIIGIFMAYSGQKSTEDGLLKSHFRWQIRTFWIGNLVVVPAAMIVNALLVYWLTDIDILIQRAASGGFGMDVALIKQDIRNFERQNALTLLGVRLLTYGVSLVWWMLRCWTGYESLKAEKPSPVPAKDKG